MTAAGRLLLLLQVMMIGVGMVTPHMLDDGVTDTSGTAQHNSIGASDSMQAIVPPPTDNTLGATLHRRLMPEEFLQPQNEPLLHPAASGSILMQVAVLRIETEQ